MTYVEACNYNLTTEEAMEENVELPRSVALRIARRHDVPADEVIESLGDRESYPASDLFIFLGY